MTQPYSLQSSIVFANGDFRRYDEAKLGLLTHALHYGTGCFEGVRGYWNESKNELFLLHLREHYERLVISARMLMMKMPHSVDELVNATLELCRRNEFKHGIYLRPFMFKSAEMIGVRLHDIEDSFALVAVPFDKYIDVEGGLNCCTSAWRRVDDNIVPARAKVTGAYINSALAKSEAILSGFDEAIMLSTDGHVSEGSAENIFVVRNGTIFTPDPSQNILEGITRRSIMQLARQELGMTVIERAIDRTELFAADEVFFTGTAIGIVPIAKIDHRLIGNNNGSNIGERLSEQYNAAINGVNPKYGNWLTPVYNG